jgi:hypothetical protein
MCCFEQAHEALVAAAKIAENIGATKAVSDRDKAVAERDEAREQNAKLREIAEKAIDYLHLGPSYDIRVASYIRDELDKLKEGAK